MGTQCTWAKLANKHHRGGKGEHHHGGKGEHHHGGKVPVPTPAQDEKPPKEEQASHSHGKKSHPKKNGGKGVGKRSVRQRRAAEGPKPSLPKKPLKEHNKSKDEKLAEKAKKSEAWLAKTKSKLLKKKEDEEKKKTAGGKKLEELKAKLANKHHHRGKGEHHHGGKGEHHHGDKGKKPHPKKNGGKGVGKRSVRQRRAAEGPKPSLPQKPLKEHNKSKAEKLEEKAKKSEAWLAKTK